MLNDIALALFVGLAAGAYSSIFIATPLVADLKEREPQMKALRKRVLAKRAKAEERESDESAAPEDGDGPGGDDGGEHRADHRPGRQRTDGAGAAAGVSGQRRSRAATGGRGRPSGSAGEGRERHESAEPPMTPTTSRELLLARIRDVPDYPQPGVMFKDITPLLADPEAFTALTDALAALCARHGATKVVGLEARGFILAAPAAVRAGLGFVPVRKAGKLPGATLGADVRAGVRHRRDRGPRRGPSPPTTGSWSSTTCWPPAAPPRPPLELIRRAGAEVVGVAVLLELGFLGGRTGSSGPWTAHRWTRSSRSEPSQSDAQRAARSSGIRRPPETFTEEVAASSCPARPRGPRRGANRRRSLPWQSDLG